MLTKYIHTFLSSIIKSNCQMLEFIVLKVFGTNKKCTQEILKCSWTVISGQKSQSCLKLRKSQNPFCHILEILDKNYENKNCNDMFIQFIFIVSQSL